MHSSFPTSAFPWFDYTVWSHLSGNISGRSQNSKKNEQEMLVFVVTWNKSLTNSKCFYNISERGKKGHCMSGWRISERILSPQVTSHAVLLWERKWVRNMCSHKSTKKPYWRMLKSDLVASGRILPPGLWHFSHFRVCGLHSKVERLGTFLILEVWTTCSKALLKGEWWS